MPAQPLLQTLRDLSPTISVGMLTADLLSLGTELAAIEAAGVKLVHVDVMDGVFCPMMTVGPRVVAAMRTPMLKDVHLMIAEPPAKLEGFVAAGADMVTVHVESTPHVHRLLQVLGGMTNANDAGRGLVRGVVLNPGTPVEDVQPLLDELEMVVLLAVNPGWGGQKFIPATGRRIDRVLDLLRRADADVLVAVDGGVNRDNVTEIARMGPDIIVTGSAVFDGKAAADNARFMLSAVADA